MPEDLDVSAAMLVVDEAHYAKNPSALRTQAVSEWAARSGRVLLLTGTPMENKVDVHRLLCEDSVDQRVLELLDGKREAFDTYAHRSDMANAAPDAVDTRSETELGRAIVAAERRRLKAA